MKNKDKAKDKEIIQPLNIYTNINKETNKLELLAVAELKDGFIQKAISIDLKWLAEQNTDAPPSIDSPAIALG